MNLETISPRPRERSARVGFDPAFVFRGDGYDPTLKATLKEVERFTMAPPERIVAVCDAVNHLHAAGDRGRRGRGRRLARGIMMAAARTLLENSARHRRIYLYDTFAGMTEPTEADLDNRGKPAGHWMRRYGRDAAGNSRWCYSSVEDVHANMASTGYPQELCSYVVGPVEETIPGVVPEQIALLRLDTDWYESTAHEMEHLFPRLVPGGVLIIDDYGHWAGSRKAVDEYLGKRDIRLLLNRTDYSGRIAVVPDGGR